MSSGERIEQALRSFQGRLERATGLEYWLAKRRGDRPHPAADPIAIAASGLVRAACGQGGF